MAFFGIDANGGVDDAVRLIVNGKELGIVESYEAVSSILELPTSFALRIGHNGVLTDLIEACGPHSPYEFRIGGDGGVLVASGRLDGFSVPGGDGTTLELRGRDRIAPLHDAFIREEKSYQSATYLDIVKTALAESGVDPGGVIVHDNKANRKTQTGVNGKAREPKNVEEIVLDKGAGGVVYKTVTAKLSERWFDFVRTHLDRAGLFLWPAANGDWVLAAPNTNQQPTYQLTLDPNARQTDGGFHGGVRRDEYREGVEPPRYSEVIVYSRTAAKKFGRGKVFGKAIDKDMIALKIDRPMSIRDADVASTEQAERLAARKIAEGRRATFRLQYTTHGHSAASLVGGGRAVWAPDTIVALDDKQAGLKGEFWVDTVTFRGSEGGRTTTLRLLRKDDVVFGQQGEDLQQLMAQQLETRRLNALKDTNVPGDS